MNIEQVAAAGNLLLVFWMKTRAAQGRIFQQDSEYHVV
ncbi:hypothetical protein B2K_18600 [Paenibacillus mucilaginosus K02]|uniref:Uncharacterized protein n=1 Tax=Paenibacillus mucilaginosus K02 TaxID=997761 RepID=I0BK07_9BACL|nr:hypothetical protein B2K_18600 [Paenibacillus mucilaginosus K02]